MVDIHKLVLTMMALCACVAPVVVSASALASSLADQSTERSSAVSSSQPAAAVQSLRARILGEVRQLADRTKNLQEDTRRLAALENFNDDDYDEVAVDGLFRLGEESKRSGAAWDMDYGWGGGRFGKRRDRLSLAGRFGRSIRNKASLKV